MNYSEMSDHEINMRMTSVLYGCEGWEINGSGDQLYHCGVDGSGHFVQGVVDFCNSWPDIGPLIASEEITILNQGDDGSCAIQWSNVNAESWNENPLRAAAIVWLMMKDAENG